MIRYYLAQDTIDRNDIEALASWLKTMPRLTKDKVTVDFEERWSRWIGRKYSVFCNSGSSANLLMYYALLLSGRLKNKKVVVPAAGWVTSLAPAIQFALEPLICEADPDTFGLDLTFLENLLKKEKPAAVLLVQVLGVPHKMKELMALKERYGFILLEDTCASVGSTLFGRKTGSFGDMSSFSFYFGHQMSTIEGGMVSTEDKGFHDLLVMLRSHGWSRDVDDAAHQALVQKYGIDDAHRPFVFYEPGFNVRSTDLNAFLGIKQLEKLDWMVRRRHENHTRYQKLLADKFTIQRCQDSQATLSTIHFCVVSESREQRHAIANALVANGIETRLFTAGNLGLHPFWFNRYGKAHFPMADRLHHCGIFLPNHPYLAEKDVDFIAHVAMEGSCVPKS
jgi:CDP-6-deoxy-D-xylo-4-hexulose-3-dehydrase